MLEYFFAYGQFRDSNHELLENATFCDKAFVYGRIYEVSKFYPGYIRESFDNVVWGDVYLVDSNIIPKLDEFEGDEYTRKKIFTSIGEYCWIYVYKYDVSKFKEVERGDWILR